MDSVTQAALGAAIGGAVMGRRLGRKSLLMGAALGTLPDLDVVIDYGDAVANVTYHRGFSHSVFLLTALATLLAGLARRFAPPRDIRFTHWWLMFWLCLVTHPLLDALTTYGTQIWWPLAVDHPTAWPQLFIIDPLFTLPMLVAIMIALWPGAPQRVTRANQWGLLVSVLYLLASFGAKQWVELKVSPALAQAGMEQAPRLVQPAPFNILLWRVTAVDGDRQAESLVGLFDGNSAPMVEIFSRGAALEADALALPSGQRLNWFAGPFLRYETWEEDDRTWLVATDLRLGFPGFHHFRFILAERQDDAWVAVNSRMLTAPDQAQSQEQPLGQLWQRALSPSPPLCLGLLEAPRWLLASPAPCAKDAHMGTAVEVTNDHS